MCRYENRESKRVNRKSAGSPANAIPKTKAKSKKDIWTNQKLFQTLHPGHHRSYQRSIQNQTKKGGSGAHIKAGGVKWVRQLVLKSLTISNALAGMKAFRADKDELET